MSLKNVSDLAKSIDDTSRYFSFQKKPTQTTASGIWFDLSMSPGNPNPNYYASAPLIGQNMSLSNNGGIYHGLGVYPKEKYLHRLMIMTPNSTAINMRLMMLDYLAYYPFIDESVTDEQVLDNSQVLITRHSEGVQAIAVVVAGQTGGQSFSIRYTNSEGVENRISQTVVMNTQAINGTLLNTAPATVGCSGPFIPLQTGDKGIRTIDGVTINGIGDVGLFTLVLVKPIADITLHEITAPTEVDYFREFGKLPVIKDDAYLNFISLPTGTLASTNILGLAEFNYN